MKSNIILLGRIGKVNWGLGHKSLKIIYEGYLGPLMSYGTPVWEEAKRKTKNSPEDADLPKTD